MTYSSFVRLHCHEQAYHTLTYGSFLGTNEEGGDVYSLYDFWVTVQENVKGFYYEASPNRPEKLNSSVMASPGA